MDQFFQSSSTSSQDDEKSTLEEVSEGAIPIDQPTAGPSTPGSQGPELPFQTHPQSQGHGLNKSSSSPELQTLPEAFSKAAMESETTSGDASWPKAPLDGKPQSQQPHVEKEKVEGSTGGDINGLAAQGQGGETPGVVSSQSGGSTRMKLEFPAATAQPGPISPSGGHRPRGHTISVSAPSSRRERRTERDSYHSRPGQNNTEKISGLSPRYSCVTFLSPLVWLISLKRNYILKTPRLFGKTVLMSSTAPYLTCKNSHLSQNCSLMLQQ